ncbi:MAG: hypothetical protein H8F28_18660 [Fibrella sp.]|nr:hypothetical protein [Armatimonadota bacterium]
MSGRSVLQIIGAVGFLFCAAATRVGAQSLDTIQIDSPALFSTEAEYEYEQDVASLIPLTEGNKRRAKPNLRTVLRRVERDWPRLLLRYAQPAVRGLLADRQIGSNALAIKTTLFRDNVKGLHLAGGFGRNTWGEREARLQFSARF